MGKKRTEKEWETWQFPTENRGTNSLQYFVVKRLRELPDIKVIKVMKANEDGVSDLLLCVKGLFVAIELKVKSNKPTKLQQQFIDEVIKAGGIAEVAYTWGDVKDILMSCNYDIDKFYPRE